MQEGMGRGLRGQAVSPSYSIVSVVQRPVFAADIVGGGFVLTFIHTFRQTAINNKASHTTGIWYMQFSWDEHNWPKCSEHGLSQDEIEDVLSGDLKVRPDLDHSQTEPRFIGIGQTQEGRFVFIAFCIRQGAVRPISARYMHQREIAKELVNVRKKEGKTHVANKNNK